MDEEIVWVGLDDFTWEAEAGEEDKREYGGSSASGLVRSSGAETQLVQHEEKKPEEEFTDFDGEENGDEESESGEEEVCENDEEEKDGDEDKEVEEPPGQPPALPPADEEADTFMKKEVVKKEAGGKTFVLDEAAVQKYLQYRKRLEDLVTSKAA